MKKQERNEDAASPVIGVMLMLVVTVVIAAVITAFATGMAGDSTSTTPMALLEADNMQMKTITYGGVEMGVLNTFDIIHKGGDEMILENIQVVYKPLGGGQIGITHVRNGQDENHLTVLGKESQKGEAVVSTGDRIRVTVLLYEHEDYLVEKGEAIQWTVSDVRTTGVIGKGEFVVGA